MRAQYSPKLSLMVWCLTCLLVAGGESTAAPPSSDQPTITQLQNQMDAMSQELAGLKSANDPAAQQQTMQRHWSMMQDYMRNMRMMPGMGPQGCADWTMMDWNTERSMMGCGWMDHGMMGLGMTSWGMPSSMSPSEYRRQMQSRMDQMRKQMAAIAAERDPAKQQTLMSELDTITEYLGKHAAAVH